MWIFVRERAGTNPYKDAVTWPLIRPPNCVYTDEIRAIFGQSALFQQNKVK